MSVLHYLLLPFSLLYGGVMAVRNFLYDKGLLASRSFPLPVICVGNLAVGGTGKTPHTEYLVEKLTAAHGDSRPRRVAVLSRGYGRRTRGFRAVQQCRSAEECGDEPWQLQRAGRPGLECFVCEDRVAGIEQLCGITQPDVILLDDAYQHRRVRAGLYILLTEHSRLYVDDWVMPAGRLREFTRGARRADVIVVTKCPDDLSEEACEGIRRRLHTRPGQPVFFTRFRYGAWQRLFPQHPAASAPDGTAMAPPPPARPARLLALSGIARPRPFQEYLRGQCDTLEVLAFPDHHRFSAADLRRLEACAAGCDAVVTTAKDAARLEKMADSLSAGLREKLYVLPIRVDFLHNSSETFYQIISDYVTENSANRSVD